MLLIHPPQAKPAEPPAGIPVLAAQLRALGHPCTVCDLNLEAFYYLMDNVAPAEDTWSRRAYRNRVNHLETLCSPAGYTSRSGYIRAVGDINRLLEITGRRHGISLSLANYQDPNLSPQKSGDLLQAAERFSENIYAPLFMERLQQLVEAEDSGLIGFSLNYLSQALCTFAMIGFVRDRFPDLQIIVGGGLVTTWLQNPAWSDHFTGLIDQLVPGPGEHALPEIAGIKDETMRVAPDYSDLVREKYLAPGFILPFAASTGCFWRKCSFCPETSEQNPYAPLSAATVVSELEILTQNTSPALIHLLDNAVSPAVLGALADHPPGSSWYGFARFSEQLADPSFCLSLRQSGCVMLKLGLESGSSSVLAEMQKGIDLKLASEVLESLSAAGIMTYVYLLFGTPAESREEAMLTRQFVRAQHRSISFLNLAIFNLPVCSPQQDQLELRDFYEGDLPIYRDFVHPRGWNRKEIRRFLDQDFKKDEKIRAILQSDPPHFTSNHAPFFPKYE